MSPKYPALAILAVLLLVPAAPGQTTAELLQKGIYTQETVGDLDGAIKIYRQITGSHVQSHAYAAQAQFRLGQCLLKKGDNAGALKAFQQLVQDYPDQKKLIEQAQPYLQGDLGLLPAPWAENELAEYEIKLPGGQQVGTVVYAVEPNPIRPQDIMLLTRGYQMGEPIRVSRVEVRSDTMRPVSSSFFIKPIIPETRIDYESRQARVQPQGKEAKVVATDVFFIDNEEATFVFRRLPLTAGYKSMISFMSPVGVPARVEASVAALEDVQVTAGKIRCYRLELPMLQQTFWIGVDAPRPLVKIEAGGATLELRSFGTPDAATPVAFTDAKTGLSFSADPGWIIRANDVPKPNESSIQLLDPQAQAWAAVYAKTIRTEKGQISNQLRAETDELVKMRTGELKDYRLRPDSLVWREIGGKQALAVVADYMELTRPMVEYLVGVQSETSSAVFFGRVPAADLDAFRKRLDRIAETAQLK